MSKNKNKQPFDWKNMTPEEKLKFEIAEELGLKDRVLEGGCKCLTSKESGRIVGLNARSKREWKHLSEQERSEEHLKKENG